jgi:hypothetical protein
VRHQRRPPQPTPTLNQTETNPGIPDSAQRRRALTALEIDLSLRGASSRWWMQIVSRLGCARGERYREVSGAPQTHHFNGLSGRVSRKSPRSRP